MVRRFNYRDEQRGPLRGYTLVRAPVGRAEATLYPLALRTCHGVAPAIGLRVGGERMFLSNSMLAGNDLATSAFAYHAELLARIPVGPVVIKPSGGAFWRRYSVAGGYVPQADYLMLGGGVEVDLKVRFIVLEVAGGLRWINRSGDLQTAAWFPQASAFGYAARARAGVALGSRVDVLAALDVDYVSFDFHIDPAGAYPNGVASGAFDAYLQATLALRIHML